MKDSIKGGLGDNMSINDIAKKHGVEVSNIKRELKNWN